MVTELASKKVTLLNPVGKSRLELTSNVLAAGTTSLQGKVIGFLDDGVSKVLFDRAMELFSRHIQPAEMVLWVKPNPSFPATPEMLAEISSKCDAAIVGTCF